MQHLFDREHWRTLPAQQSGLDFSSNDYLGLARSLTLREKISYAYAELPIKRNGSTGSRLLTGNSLLAVETEAFLADNFQAPAALIYGSGYVANLSVLSCLPQRGDTIIYDEHAHASIKDGARLSLATRWSFAHNDMEDLRSKLGKAGGHKWIVVESLYSMDGTYAPLRDVCTIAKEYGAYTIVDEAHSTGAIGNRGAGVADVMNVVSDIDVRIYTFGKAMGIHGACVVGSQKLIQYLVNFSRPFIYTTAPDDHSLIATRAAFEFLRENVSLQTKLSQVIDSFVRQRRSLSSAFVKSESQIQALIVPGRENVLTVAGELKARGLDVRPILSPTVPEGTERIRLCLHAFNEEKDLQHLMKAIEECRLVV